MTRRRPKRKAERRKAARKRKPSPRCELVPGFGANTGRSSTDSANRRPAKTVPQMQESTRVGRIRLMFAMVKGRKRFRKKIAAGGTKVEPE